MPFFGAGTLQDALKRSNGSMAVKDVWRYASSIASAASHFHRNGMVHRDLKPDNVLLGSSGEVVVSDFGLVKALPRGTTARSACGTPGYMAPEVAQGRPYGPKADAYSLGAMMHELLTGELPPQDTTTILTSYDERMRGTVRALLASDATTRMSVDEFLEIPDAQVYLLQEQLDQERQEVASARQALQRIVLSQTPPASPEFDFSKLTLASQPRPLPTPPTTLTPATPATPPAQAIAPAPALAAATGPAIAGGPAPASRAAPLPTITFDVDKAWLALILRASNSHHLED